MDWGTATKIFDSSVIRQASEAMHLMSSILESSTECSILGKDLEGRARRLCGHGPEEGVGRTNSSILHIREDVKSAKAREIMQAALRDRKWEGTFDRVRINAQRFTARVVITSRCDASGRTIGVLLISKDTSASVFTLSSQEKQ